MPSRKPVTAPDLIAMKRKGQRIVVVTAYDYPSARYADAAGVDAILVGDSLGMVVLGHSTTVPVTLDDILHHVRAVVRAQPKALVIADMPVLTFQISPEEALRNAGRLLQEGGAQAVKVEGGERTVPVVERLTAAGIPVVGHLGLTPQSVNETGGFRLQAKTAADAAQLLRDARAMEAAGAFAVVLELIPAEVAKGVSEQIGIPTIGIGAGPYCDGEVQVFHDVVGLLDWFVPRHTKQYANIGAQIKTALEHYAADVRSGGEHNARPGPRRPRAVEVIRTVASLREAAHGARTSGSTIGLVPTMGALHEGHLSLIRRARAECDFVITTIFVNPTQFAPTEDLSRYPRPFEADCRLAGEAGTNVVFAPPVEEVYPAGFSTHVAVEGLTAAMEGASRPTHFQGVTTVVAKLFNMAQADRAYFGQKDFQQLQVIRRMAIDLDFPIRIIACPTVREPDGLAMSSRNVYLTPDQRRAALSLSQGLQAAETAFNSGERDSTRLCALVASRLASEPLVRPDYVELAEAATLAPLAQVDRPAILCVAAYVGATRLIDNTLLEP